MQRGCMSNGNTLTRVLRPLPLPFHLNEQNTSNPQVAVRSLIFISHRRRCLREPTFGRSRRSLYYSPASMAEPGRWAALKRGHSRPNVLSVRFATSFRVAWRFSGGVVNERVASFSHLIDQDDCEEEKENPEKWLCEKTWVTFKLVGCKGYRVEVNKEFVYLSSHKSSSKISIFQHPFQCWKENLSALFPRN